MSHRQARLVFVTRYRRGVFDDAMLTDCEHAIRQVCADLRAELAEFHGGPDHVHLLVRYPPTVTRSRLVNSLKGVCSRRLRAQYAANSCPRVDRAGTCGHLWAPVVAVIPGRVLRRGRPSRSSRSTSVDINDPASRGLLPALKDGVYALEHR